MFHYGVLGRLISVREPGADYAMLDVRRKSGRAKYDPLWRVRGGEAWTPTVSEKNANTMFAFFSSSQPTATAVGCPSPFEALMHEFATGTTGATTERREWREQTPPFVLVEGKARRRGGGTIYAASNPPPNYDEPEGCAALGGRIMMSSPGLLKSE